MANTMLHTSITTGIIKKVVDSIASIYSKPNINSASQDAYLRLPGW